MIRGYKFGRGVLVLLFLFVAIPAVLFPAGHVLASESVDTCAREILQAVVHTAGSSLSETLKSIPGEKERTEMIRNFVKSVRFFPDKSGYIYVYTLDGLVVGHGGMKDLERRNLIDHKDTKGNYDVRMAIATAKKGGGFFEHYWKRPGMQGEFKKVTYVEPVAGANYFIGAGAYVP